MIYCDSNEASIFNWILDFSNSVVFFVFILVNHLIVSGMDLWFIFYHGI